MKPGNTQHVGRNAEPSFTFKDEEARLVTEPVAYGRDIVLVKRPRIPSRHNWLETIARLSDDGTANGTSEALATMGECITIAQGDVVEAEFVTGDVFQPDSGEAINRVVREHSTTVGDWKYQPQMSELYTWADRFNERLFNGELPGVLLSFAWDRVTTLGTFQPGRDELGIKYHINLNLRFMDRPFSDHLNTLLHEMLHASQEQCGTGGKGNYHNVEFRRQAAAFGIPCDSKGCSLPIEAGPFTRLLAEFGVPLVLAGASTGARPKGKSTLNKYRCPCGQNVWSGKKSLQAKCTVCDGAFGLCS